MKNNQKGSVVIIIAPLVIIALIVGGYLFMRSRQSSKDAAAEKQTSQASNNPPDTRKEHSSFTITTASAIQKGSVVNASAQLPRPFTGICQFGFTSKNSYRVAGEHVNIKDESSCSVELPVSDFDPGYWSMGVLFLSYDGEYSGISDKKFVQIK